MKYRFRHVCEYLLMRASVWFIRILPYRAAVLAGWIIAFLGHYVARFRSREAKRRIRDVFRDRYSEREIARIAWISWRNFVLCAVDMIRLARMTRRWLELHIVDFSETERAFKELASEGRGVIFACPHMGSWELGGVVAQAAGVPLFFFAARQRNPLVNEYINRMRSATGIATIERGASSVLKQVVRRLKNGQSLGFLPDVRMPTQGVTVSFLGGNANVGSGMALFARLAGVPVAPGIVTRVGLTRHRILLKKPIYPDQSVEKHNDCQRVTQEVLSVIEQAIREQPEQWFWYNKRWILDPLEPPAEMPDAAD